MQWSIFWQLVVVLPIVLVVQPVWAEDRLEEIENREQTAEPSRVINHTTSQRQATSLEQNEERLINNQQPSSPAAISHSMS